MTIGMWKGRWLAVWLALPLTGCALGSVRQVKVAALGPYEDARGVTVEVRGAVPEPLQQELQQSFLTGVETRARRPVGASGAPLRVDLHVLEATAPTASTEPLSDNARLAQQARTKLGLTGWGDGAGRLALEGVLLSPEGDTLLGVVRWEAEGDPARLASAGAREAGEALGRKMELRREEFVNRRAADERMLFTPTALTLAPGEVVFSNDELLLFRLGVGVSRRVQLDAWFSTLVIPPAVGGFPTPFGGGVAVGGVGAFLVFDLGLKVKVLEEQRYVPGVAVGYDFLYAAGGGLGGAFLFGHGVVGVAGLAGGNVQFNLLTAVAAKHWGDFQLTLGTYVLDNHHFIPQQAVFVAGAVGGGSGDAVGGTVERDQRLPTQVQPFVGAQYVLGPHSELSAELLPRAPLTDSVLTTSVRWLIGPNSAPQGPLAYDRLRLRVDLGVLWAAHSRESSGTRFLLPLPWLGLGFYKL